MRVVGPRLFLAVALEEGVVPAALEADDAASVPSEIKRSSASRLSLADELVAAIVFMAPHTVSKQNQLRDYAGARRPSNLHKYEVSGRFRY